MSEAALTGNQQTELQRDEFDGDCLRVFDSAQGVAEMIDSARIHPSHLLLGALSQENGYLDEKLRRSFGGLKASTIADSLREIVELGARNAETEDTQGGRAAEMTCSGAALVVLARAAELSRLWQAQRVTLPALVCALLENVDRDGLEAFGDATLSRAQLQDLAGAIAMEQEDGPKVQKEVFANDCVRLDSFGPVAREGLVALTQMGENRLLLAEDLLIAFLAHERSRTAEALHVMGANPATVLSALQQKYGTARGARGVSSPRARMGRMLVRIIEQAGELAARERSELIGESHLMRAYIARVATESGNVLEKLNIPALQLSEYLKRRSLDREAAGAAEGGAAMVSDVEGYLRQRVVGQEEAIRAVVPALQRMRLGMNEPGRPLGVFLFLGATGVGKTELAKAVADIAFGPKPGVVEPYMVRVECGSLTEPSDIVQLLGARQGLVGYKEGKLTNGLRDKGSRCIILFDEAEKAHPKVWQSLLTFFDEGVVTEADGTRYDATGCILVATSNLGYREATEKFRLFDLSQDEMARVQPQIQVFIWKHVEGYFSPEFRGRFGRQNVLFFNNFRREHYQAMISSQIGKIVEEMEHRGIEVAVDAEVPRILEEMAWEGRQNGARDVRRLVTRHLRDRIVNALVADPSARKVNLGVSAEMTEFEESHGAKAPLRGETADAEAYLTSRVVRQERAIRAVVPALKRMRAGLHEHGRLKGAFLFLGATGVGKTELARAIADVAFGPRPEGKDGNLILINCGALTEPRDVVQILGAPQGLVGYKEGILTNGLRDKGGRCVILFDEAEKAHPKIWQSLLQLFDDGIVMEADGTQYDATGCVLVATSNLGYAGAIDKLRLYERTDAELEQLRPQVEEFIWKQVTEYFSPEFRGRFGRENVLFFNHFTRNAYREILEKQITQLASEMAEKGIELAVEPPVLDALADMAWEKRAEGARQVRRLITQYVRDAVVNARADNPRCASVQIGYGGKLQQDHVAVQAQQKARSVDDPESYLNARVINQKQAVHVLVPAIKRMRLGMNEAGRMAGTFLFLGPSGVGKTELAKATADVVFGPKPGLIDPYLIRIDCGKFTEPRDIVQLVGAPQGLVGYKEGVLTNGLREKGSRCVIVFDEAEKANPQIWQSLLTLFDEGIVTEADGTRYDATGCLLVATSNLGYKEAVQAFRLFEIAPEDAEALRPQVEQFIWNKVTGYFSPEFLGRFGRENIVLFNHFGRADYRAILANQMESLVAEMQGRGLGVTVDDAVVDRLVDFAWERRNEGARTVRRIVTGYLRNSIVDGLETDSGRRAFHFALRDDGEIAALEK